MISLPRILLGMLLTGGASAHAAVHVVHPDGTGDFPTIQAALDAATAGDTIELSDGFFTGDGNRDLDFGGKVLTLRGESGNADVCVLNCQGTSSDTHRGFHFRSGEGPGSIIADLTVWSGWGHYDEFTISRAGAVFCEDASPTITRCAFVENRADFGGAIVIHGGAAPLIEDCRFILNSATYEAGAICSRDSVAVEIDGCTFTDNAANIRAGAFLADDFGTPHVIDCTFVRNTAPNGGAAYICGEAEGLFERCTFVSNGANPDANSGAGLFCACHGLAVMDACIIAFSPAGSAVGQLSGGEIELACTDIFGNAHGDWVAYIADQYGVDGNFAADPLFCAAASDVYTLDTTSPCLPGRHPFGSECGLIGAHPVGCPANGVPERPGAALCGTWYPNPMLAGAQTRLALPGAERGVVAIYDAQGRLCRTLVLGSAESVTWDGADDGGRLLPAGIYFSRSARGRGDQVRTIQLLR